MLGEIFLATAHWLEAILNLKRFLVVIYSGSWYVVLGFVLT